MPEEKPENQKQEAIEPTPEQESPGIFEQYFSLMETAKEKCNASLEFLQQYEPSPERNKLLSFFEEERQNNHEILTHRDLGNVRDIGPEDIRGLEKIMQKYDNKIAVFEQVQCEREIQEKKEEINDEFEESNYREKNLNALAKEQDGKEEKYVKGGDSKKWSSKEGKEGWLKWGWRKTKNTAIASKNLTLGSLKLAGGTASVVSTGLFHLASWPLKKVWSVSRVLGKIFKKIGKGDFESENSFVQDFKDFYEILRPKEEKEKKT